MKVPRPGVVGACLTALLISACPILGMPPESLILPRVAWYVHVGDSIRFEKSPKLNSGATIVLKNRRTGGFWRKVFSSLDSIPESIELSRDNLKDLAEDLKSIEAYDVNLSYSSPEGQSIGVGGFFHVVIDRDAQFPPNFSIAVFMGSSISGGPGIPETPATDDREASGLADEVAANWKLAVATKSVELASESDRLELSRGHNPPQIGVYKFDLKGKAEKFVIPSTYTESGKDVVGIPNEVVAYITASTVPVLVGMKVRVVE